MKSKLEIIEETKDFYSEDTSRRSYDQGACHYYKDGKMSAVGRCLINPLKLEEHGMWVNIMSIEYLDTQLKTEYRGHDIDFWESLQDFHDNDENWVKNGLSDLGNKVYQKLLSNI